MDITSGFEGQLANSANEPSLIFNEGYSSEANVAQFDNQSSQSAVNNMFGELQLTDTTSDPDSTDSRKFAAHTNRNNGSGDSTNERDALLDRRLT